jgi:hypothetical protein
MEPKSVHPQTFIFDTVFQPDWLGRGPKAVSRRHQDKQALRLEETHE